MTLGSDRPPDVEKRVTDAVFDAILAPVADLPARRFRALSMECHAFDEAGTHQRNNIQSRFRPKAG